MRTTLGSFGVVAILATGIACGGDGGNGGTGPNSGDFVGTYAGQATVTDQSDPGNPFTVSATLVVTAGSGTSFDGVWLISGSAGTLSGALSGTSASFTMDETSPCAGLFTGTATISAGGDQATGQFSGTDCDGTFTITFALTRTSGGTSLTGDYTGTANVQGFGAVNVRLTIIQSGNALSGTWSTSIGGAGDATGLVSGSSVQFTLTQLVPCSGSYSGTGSIQNNGSRITGSYAGSDCGTPITASFTVNRQ